MRVIGFVALATLVVSGGGCGDGTSSDRRDGSQKADAAGGAGGMNASQQTDGAGGAERMDVSNRREVDGGVDRMDVSNKPDWASGADRMDVSNKPEVDGGVDRMDVSNKPEVDGGVDRIDVSERIDADGGPGCLFRDGDGGLGTEVGMTEAVGSGLRITTDPPAGTVLSVGVQQTITFTVSSVDVDAGGVEAGTSVVLQAVLAVSGSSQGQYTMAGNMLQSFPLATVDTRATQTVTVTVTPPRKETAYEWVLMSFWIAKPGTVIPKPLDVANPNQWLVFPVGC